MRILPVCLLSLIACSLRGQVATGEAGEMTEAEMIRRKQAAAGHGDTEALGPSKEKEAAEWARMTPEQRLQRTATHGAGTYLRLDASVHPARLLPGQTGTVKVTFSLLGDAVIPSPAPLTWQTPAVQGDVSLGQPTLLPAKPSNVAKGYSGQQVYDAWAIAELPITVAPTAKLGSKVPFRLDLTVDLFSGASAQTIGRFIDHANGVVEIGQSHDPAVQAAQRPADGVGDDGAPNGTKKQASEKPPGKTTNGAIEVRGAAQIVPVQDPSPQAGEKHDSAPPVHEVESSDLPIPMLLAGGGALVLVVVLLLVAKRR